MYSTGPSLTSEQQPSRQQHEQPEKSDPSSSPRNEGKKELPPLPTEDVVYHGPLSSQHKLLKRISLTNTAIACGAAPLIIEYTDISYVSRIGLASSLVLLGLITTAALHWVAHPYVHELHYDAKSKDITVTLATLFGTKRKTQFNLADVQPLPWNRPVATFTAKGQFYYIDVYSFPNEALLRRLTPDEDSVPEGYKEDADDD